LSGLWQNFKLKTKEGIFLEGEGGDISDLDKLFFSNSWKRIIQWLSATYQKNWDQNPLFYNMCSNLNGSTVRFSLITILYQQTHFNINLQCSYIIWKAPTCFGTVVPSSGSSTFLANITHIWCAHTTNPNSPIAIIAKIIPRFQDASFFSLSWQIMWEIIPNTGRMRIYTSVCPKNQKHHDLCIYSHHGQILLVFFYQFYKF
jgi:hypothetical protein